MADIVMSDLPAKASLLDSDVFAIDDGAQTYKATGKQLREFLKVNFLPMGTVVWSQSASYTDNVGRLPLFTGEYIANASTLYPDFYSWVKNNSQRYKTKAQYDALMAEYGECPYYVVDEVEGSLRLPKLVNYIKSATAAEGITQKGAGLPNITGKAKIGGTGSNPIAIPTTEGAFSTYERGNTMTRGENTGPNSYGLSIDASHSSAVYGSSDTVTPAHTTLYPWVYAFNAAVPASTVQAAEFTGALAGKANADLSNCPANYDYVVESYSDDQGNWYRKYKSGWLEQGGLAYSSSGDAAVTLLKPYADTGFAVMTTNEKTSDINAYGWTYIISKTTTGFTISSKSGSGSAVTCNARWEAKGQGAE